MDPWWKNFIRLVVVFCLLVGVCGVLALCKDSDEEYKGTSRSNLSCSGILEHIYKKKVYVLKTMPEQTANAIMCTDWSKHEFANANEFLEALYSIPCPRRCYVSSFQRVGYSNTGQLFEIPIKSVDEKDTTKYAMLMTSFPIDRFACRVWDSPTFVDRISGISRGCPNRDDTPTDNSWKFVVTNFGEDQFGVWVELVCNK